MSHELPEKKLVEPAVGANNFDEQTIWIDCQVEGCPHPRQGCRAKQISSILLDDASVTISASLRKVEGCTNNDCGSVEAKKSFQHSPATELLLVVCRNTVVIDLQG